MTTDRNLTFCYRCGREWIYESLTSESMCNCGPGVASPWLYWTSYEDRWTELAYYPPNFARLDLKKCGMAIYQPSSNHHVSYLSLKGPHDTT
jgi:hypothetical protein